MIVKQCLIALCLASQVFGLDLVIRNQLYSDLTYPKTHLPDGGLEFSPSIIKANSTSYLVLTEHSDNTTFEGAISFSIKGTLKKIQIAWKFDHGTPKNSHVSLQDGSEDANQNLYNTLMGAGNFSDASAGWHTKTLSGSKIEAHYFMSTSSNNPGIIVELMEHIELAGNKFYIQSIAPDFNGMFIKLSTDNRGATGVLETHLAHFLENERTRYQWKLELFNDGYYRVKSVHQTNYAWYAFLHSFYYTEARTSGTSFSGPDWEWEINQVITGIFTFRNRFAGRNLNLEVCRTADFPASTTSAPAGGHCMPNLPLTLLEENPATVETTRFRLIPVHE